ncbi:GtrA family protein [Legionella sp. km535]|uniref:GtrA family protein n=1 Tax=Legionella sp. km535 TaxID=2498107 RepID=UPI0026B27E36
MPFIKKAVKLQMFGFAGSGLISTLIMFVMYVILHKLINYQYAYLISYSISIIALNFMNTFVFKKSISFQNFFEFPLIYLLQYLAGAASLELIVRLGFSVTFAPLLIVVILLPVTYILNRMLFLKN